MVCVVKKIRVKLERVSGASDNVRRVVFVGENHPISVIGVDLDNRSFKYASYSPYGSFKGDCPTLFDALIALKRRFRQWGM